MNRNLRVILCEDNQFAGKYESISKEILIFYLSNKQNWDFENTDDKYTIVKYIQSIH